MTKKTAATAAPAAAAMLLAVVVAVLATGAAGVSVDDIRITRNGNYNPTSQSQKYTPNGFADGAAAPTAPTGPECAAVWATRNAVRKPPRLRYTFDNTKGYHATAGAAATNFAAFGAAIDHVAAGGVHRAPMFVPAWGNAAGVINGLMGTPLRHPFPAHAGAATPHPPFSDNAQLPRVYDPRYTDRDVVVVVPEADFAAWKGAVGGVARVHVVGCRARGNANGQDSNLANENQYWGFGFLRFCTLKLMKETYKDHNGLALAWMVDGNAVALRAGNAANSLARDGAAFDALENAVRVHNAAAHAAPPGPAPAGAGGHVVAIVGVPGDAQRANHNAGHYWANSPGLGGAVAINPAVNPLFLQQMVLFDMAEMGPAYPNFPCAFPLGKEDKALYRWLAAEAAAGVADALHYAEFDNARLIKTPAAVGAHPAVAPACVVPVATRGGQYQTYDQSALANVVHVQPPGGAYALSSAANFVCTKLRDRRGPGPELVLDTAIKVIDTVLDKCISLHHAHLKANAQLEYFFEDQCRLTGRAQ